MSAWRGSRTWGVVAQGRQRVSSANICRWEQGGGEQRGGEEGAAKSDVQPRQMKQKRIQKFFRLCLRTAWRFFERNLPFLRKAFFREATRISSKSKRREQGTERAGKSRLERKKETLTIVVHSVLTVYSKSIKKYKQWGRGGTRKSRLVKRYKQWGRGETRKSRLERKEKTLTIVVKRYRR